MKTISMLVILWMTIAVELAWSRSLPHGALVLPIACGIMFWMRSVTGILLSATALLIDWVARPGCLPLCPMLLPAIAACLISPSAKPDDYSSLEVSHKYSSNIKDYEQTNVVYLKWSPDFRVLFPIL